MNQKHEPDQNCDRNKEPPRRSPQAADAIRFGVRARPGRGNIEHEFPAALGALGGCQAREWVPALDAAGVGVVVGRGKGHAASLRPYRKGNSHSGMFVSSGCMPQAPVNPEPAPAVCPACGYDMAGALGVTCPECGVDVVKEHARLGPRQSVLLIVVPLVIQTLMWAVAMSMSASTSRRSGLIPLSTDLRQLSVVMFAVQGGLVVLSVTGARWFARAPFRTQDSLTWLSWLLFLPPVVLFLSNIR